MSSYSPWGPLSLARQGLLQRLIENMKNSHAYMWEVNKVDGVTMGEVLMCAFVKGLMHEHAYGGEQGGVWGRR